MNRLFFLYYLFLSLSLIAACNSGVSETEKPFLQTYTNKEIGWSIKIPLGFKLTSKAKRYADDQKGKEAIGKVYKGELKMDSLRHLVSFNKNQFNAFDSTIEPYLEEEDGDYEANNILVNKLIYDTYHKQGIKVDTSSARISVKGQLFNAFYIRINGPNGEVALNQIMYSKMINGYDFGVNINYNNDADKKTLMNVFMQSNFR